MSEDVPEQPAPTAGAGEADRPTETSPRTGVPEVDAVLDDVDTLADRPVEEHAAVVEDAHRRLRRALDGDPTDTTDTTAGAG